jgi:signal transduction histidine kinase
MVKTFAQYLKAPKPNKATPELVRRYALTSFVIVACFVINVLGWFFDYFVAYSEQLMLIDLVGVVFYFVLLVFYWATGRQTISASIFFISILIYISYTACYFGKEAYLILYVYNLIVIGFFIFNVKSWAFALLLSMSFAFICLLEIFNYQFVQPIELSELQMTQLRFFAGATNFILFIVAVLIIDRNNRKLELSLISDRIKVEELSQRLQMLCSLKEEYNTSLHNQYDSMLISRNDLHSISSITSMRSEEKERARIGKELSQTVGEILVRIKLRMGNLSGAIKTFDRMEFEEALRMIDMASEEIYKFSEILDPMEFNKLDLAEALRIHVKTLKQKFGLTLDYLNVGYKNQLAKEQELVVFRVVSDILRESIERAGATRCDLRLEVIENYMSVRIQDNARNCSELERERFFREFSFQERVQVISGFVHSKTDIGIGNITLIEIPILAPMTPNEIPM